MPSGITKARFMAIAPNGDVFVSETKTGRVVVLPDRNHDGKSDGVFIFASGLNRPHGLAFHTGFLYVANTNAVVRFAYQTGDLRASARATTLVKLQIGRAHV